MILVLDIGNTNIEFGIFEMDQLKANFRLMTNRNVTSDEIGLLMTQFFDIHHISKNDFEDVVIASVVPQVMFSVSNAMKKYLQKTPCIVEETIAVPIEIRGCNRNEIGVDRLVDAYAAFQKYGGPLVVVDFGTATTFDVVNENGVYYGGPTCAGLKTGMEALYHNASMLPMIELEAPESILPIDTISSMQAGAVFGTVGTVSYIIQKINQEIGKKAIVVATGGFCGLIGSQTDCIDKLDKTLTLQGIYDIYRAQDQ